MISKAQQSTGACRRRAGFGRGVAIAWLAAGALVATMPAAAVGDAASEAGAGGARANYAVEIRNFAFAPKDLSVPAGARIVWTNRDEEPHVVVSVGGAFKSSPALDTNDSFSAVLAKPGTYSYYCGIHPVMVGRIVVR
jgi:plastocyanin